jgi:hypothetical protein
MRLRACPQRAGLPHAVVAAVGGVSRCPPWVACAFFVEMNGYRLRLSLLLAAAAGWIACGTARVSAQALSTAREIAAHFTPKDGQPAGVSLEATVTFQDPGLTIFLRDETGVTFVRAARIIRG